MKVENLFLYIICFDVHEVNDIDLFVFLFAWKRFVGKSLRQLLILTIWKLSINFQIPITII